MKNNIKNGNLINHIRRITGERRDRRLILNEGVE